MNEVMITGCTSAIGARVLAAVAARPDVARIHVLSDAPGAGPESRARAGTDIGLHILDGDPSQPRFGLDERAFADLCASVDTIFHCAERTTIDRDIEAARARNVQPVATLIEMLERNPAARLAHVSTTMVAGTKRGLFTEVDLDCGQRFHNAYEQSKLEAESMLRASAVSARVTVLRRSLTLDEACPATARPSTPLAGLLASLRRGGLVLLAGDPRMHLDVVSPSYVAASVVALAAHPEAGGKTLHLVAGWERAWSLADLAAAVRRHVRRGRVHFIPPALAPLARILGILGLGLVAIFPGRRAALGPYFRHRCAFDDFQARALLAPMGLACPAPDASLAELLDAADTPAAARISTSPIEHADHA